MKLRIVLCTLFIGILAGHITAQSTTQTPDSNRARAIALWEEVIRAKGGRERLHAVENLQIVSKVKVEAPTSLGLMETRRLYVLPDRAWLRASSAAFPGGLEATIFSIDRRLCTVKITPSEANLPGGSPCSLPGWSAHLIQDPVMYLLETKWIQPKVLGSRAQRSGDRQVDVIEVEVTRMRVDYYLDSKTRLPFKVVINKSAGTAQLAAHPKMTIKFSDYASVDGIQMPRSIVRESAVRPSLPTRDTELAEYSFNVDYDESLFDLSTGVLPTR